MANKTDKIDIADFLDKYRSDKDKDAGMKIFWQYLQDIFSVCEAAFYGDDNLVEKYKDFALDYYIRQIDEGKFLRNFVIKSSNVEKELKNYLTIPFLKNRLRRYVDFCRSELKQTDSTKTTDEVEALIGSEEYYPGTTAETADTTVRLKTKLDIYEELLKGNYNGLHENKSLVADIVKLPEDKVDDYLKEFEIILYKIREEESTIDGKLKENVYKKQELEKKLKEGRKQEYDISEINNSEKKIQQIDKSIERLKTKMDKCRQGLSADFCSKFLNTTKSNLYKMKVELKSRLELMLKLGNK